MSNEVILTEWKKKNGQIIKLNDNEATVEMAKSLGWEKKKGPKSKVDKD